MKHFLLALFLLPAGFASAQGICFPEDGVKHRIIDLAVSARELSYAPGIDSCYPLLVDSVAWFCVHAKGDRAKKENRMPWIALDSLVESAQRVQRNAMPRICGKTFAQDPEGFGIQMMLAELKNRHALHNYLVMDLKKQSKKAGQPAINKKYKDLLIAKRVDFKVRQRLNDVIDEATSPQLRATIGKK